MPPSLRWVLIVAIGGITAGSANVAGADVAGAAHPEPVPAAPSPAAPSPAAPPPPAAPTPAAPSPSAPEPTTVPAPEPTPTTTPPVPEPAAAPTATSTFQPAAITWVPRLLVQSDAVVARHGPDANAVEDGTTHPGLYLRRARVGTDAVAGVWRARVMIEAASQSEVAAVAAPSTTPATPGTPPTPITGLDPIAGEISGRAPRATEAFVALAPHKAFSLSAGSLRVPIGLSRQIDEGDLRLPERARVIARATPDFRVGVTAGGDTGLLQYAIGTYAAAPTFGSDFAGGGTLYVVRLSGEPMGPMGHAPHLRRRDDPWYGWWRFSAGLSGFFAQLPGVDEWGLGGDGQFQWRRLCISGETLWTRRATVDRVGFTVEPGVFLSPDRLELVARFEWLNDEVGPQTRADAWGASIGATFFSVTRRARLQAAYTLRQPTAGDERPSGWAVLRATFTL